MKKSKKSKKLKPGDTAIIKLTINRLYETNRWIFITPKMDDGYFLAIGKDFNIYSGGRVVKNRLNIYTASPRISYEESDYKMIKEDYQTIIKEIFNDKDIENFIEKFLK